MTHEWKVAVGVLWISGCAGAPEATAMDTVVFPGNGTTEAKSQAVFFDVGGRYGLNVDVENAYDLDSAEIQFDMAED